MFKNRCLGMMGLKDGKLGFLVDPGCVPFYVITYEDNTYLYNSTECYTIQVPVSEVAADLQAMHGIDVMDMVVGMALNNSNLVQTLESYKATIDELEIFNSIIEEYEPDGGSPGFKLFER